MYTHFSVIYLWPFNTKINRTNKEHETTNVYTSAVMKLLDNYEHNRPYKQNWKHIARGK